MCPICMTFRCSRIPDPLKFAMWEQVRSCYAVAVAVSSRRQYTGWSLTEVYSGTGSHEFSSDVTKTDRK